MSAFMTRLTYGQFLALFLLPPIAGLIILTLRDRRRAARTLQTRGQAISRWLLLIGLVVVAIVYTVPWDNHLIANGVWTYDPSRVSGITLDRIPLEELLFFPLQTLLVGLWALWLIPRSAMDEIHIPMDEEGHDGWQVSGRLDGAGRQREKVVHKSAVIACWIALVVSALTWLVALGILLRGWRPGTYLGWELVWALPPLALQLGLGADLLWRRRWLLLTALLPAVGYLATADALAIHAGIWTIAPQQSLGIQLGGVLPLEELIFFLLTSALVVGGLVLGAELESRKRFRFGVRVPSRATSKSIPVP